ncbi:MAG: LPXTG cell wall anchor domain-containing protein [Lactobacillus sp.]|nr:LPXTG cell wall anchor domain-containing protein [Lactobacillus sp.]
MGELPKFDGGIPDIPEPQPDLISENTVPDKDTPVNSENLILDSFNSTRTMQSKVTPKNYGKNNSKLLPQTGRKNTTVVSILGLAAIGFTVLLSLVGDKRKKRN